ncbi:transcriptional regulator, ArsR family [Longilinea arvoryzae]|uniref:Transcriptional regulator, ArsR family n=1 Tax=Longilinea arvoryzae TaxID=360412 RepID=A0A0S7B5D5_9CHLR|nr:transcriptional regulator [Longilinea arvoryzae]GAP12351.1 transcriptional regulator, ArsR family [Longilinea arvoryzae]
MSDELHRITEVDRLIHEPARLLIVTLLVPVEKVDFLYLLHETGLTKGNLSAHLSKLEEAGYVQIEKTYRGKIPQTLIQLTPAGKEAFEDYREKLKRIVSRLSQE